MSIPYTYEIIGVDQQARVMEVVYSSPGRQTMHIGARLPYAGESLDAVIQMYSPVAYWREQEAVVIDVQPGTSGSFTPPGVEPTTLGSAKQAKLEEIAAWRFLRETGGVQFNGATIKTDRESQATVNGAFASLQAGLVSSIDWKAANGVWVTLTLTEMTAIAQAVASHVQASFTAEKQLADQVAAATTIEEVNAIAVPWVQVGVQIPVTEL